MDEPNVLRKSLEDGMSRGFRAFKIGWGPFGRVDRKTDEKIVKTARETIGPDNELMVDAGGSDAFWPNGYKWALETSKMLADYEVTWFEEALRPDDLEGHIKLTENSPVPIAGCEVLTRRQSFLEWIERRAVDYIQPDVTKVGGLSEEHRIAQYADDHSIRFVPHGWNTAVGLAADLQLLAAAANARWVEYITPAPYIENLLLEPIVLDESDGTIALPDGPGLGMKWNPDGVEKIHRRNEADGVVDLISEIQRVTECKPSTGSSSSFSTAEFSLWDFFWREALIPVRNGSSVAARSPGGRSACQCSQPMSTTPIWFH